MKQNQRISIKNQSNFKSPKNIVKSNKTAEFVELSRNDKLSQRTVQNELNSLKKQSKNEEVEFDFQEEEVEREIQDFNNKNNN